MNTQQLRETIAAKRAYGVKTTRLENELYRMERAALSAWRRKLNDVVWGVVLWTATAFLWGLILLPIWSIAWRWFNN